MAQITHLGYPLRPDTPQQSLGNVTVSLVSIAIICVVEGEAYSHPNIVSELILYLSNLLPTSSMNTVNFKQFQIQNHSNLLFLSVLFMY